MNLFPPKPRLNYNELPEAAPTPKCWKSLGHVEPGIEMHYAIDSYSRDLDVDRESELKMELMAVGQTLTVNGVAITGMVLVRDATIYTPQRIVRFVECSCGTNLYTTRN